MDYEIGEKVIILDFRLIDLPRNINHRYIPDDDLIGKIGTINRFQGKYMDYDIYNVSIECGINPNTGNLIERTVFIYGMCLTLQKEKKQFMIYDYSKDYSENFKESDGNNMNQGIVKMWKEKIINKIKSDSLNQSEKIKRQDIIYSKKLELEEEMVKFLKQNGYEEYERIEFKCNSDFKFYTSETDNKLYELNKKCDSKIRQVEDTAKEVLIMITDCQSYEQSIEILKSYGIVDSSDKLNVDISSIS